MKILQAIATLPAQTQIAVAVIKQGIVSYYGAINDQPINNSTAAFEIGSVTKAFTGHVLAQLITENKVGLNDLVQEYLPFYFPHAITLKHLAQHTSGLPRMPPDYETQSNYDSTDPFKHYTEAQLATYLTENFQPESQPGEKHLYSNLGAGLLSYIIGRVEERPFAQVVTARIFEPLQMVHSTFETPVNIVRGIDDKGNFCSNWDGGLLNGCLGITSTTEDMVRFALMINDLSNTAANLQMEETFVVDELVKSNLGWGERLILPENIRMRGINGGTGGYGASLLLNREAQCAVVILSNIWPWHYMDIIYPLGKELLTSLSI